VDNSPADNLKTFAEISDSIVYIFNNRNLGYGKAHNIAVRKTIEDGIKYHLVLNPDVCFEPRVIENIYEFMEKNPDVGILMPKILYPDGSIQYLCKLLPAPVDVISRRFVPIKKSVEKRNEAYELRFTKYDKIMEVPYLSGCFMFIRTAVFEKAGLFDERFFLYFEDVDLSRRIHRYYRTVYYPEVFIYHGFEKGSYKNFKLLKHHIVSAIRYFNKWGWFFDKEKERINKETLEKISLNLF
jgi:hypothetical protein